MSSAPTHQKSSSIEATQQELESFLAEADGETRKSGDLSSSLGLGTGASINPAQVNTSTGQGAENALKQAAAATAGGGGKVKISPYVIIPIWICISGTVILFNSYIFKTLKFEYPIFLTFYHMFFATIGTNALKHFTTMLNGVNDIEMTRPLYLRTILPIGALFSMSLIFSNTAYLTLSVSFIQMLKAFMPVAVLLISFAVRIEQPNRVLFAIVVLISSGCAIAAYGELSFAMSGFIFQCSAIAVEAARLVLIQILLQGMKMDPLVSVYFYAPVCTAMIGFCLIFTEGLLPFQNFSRVGLPILLLNGTIAFSLNIASVFLIGSAGGLILTLAGVVKDILLIMISMTLFGTGVSLVQAFGYAIALGGLMLFKTQGQKK